MEATAGGHALILDLNARRSSAIAETLRAQGYSIAQMQGVGAALALCSRVPFTVLLVGELPPDHDRPAACRALRQMSNSAIIVLIDDTEPSTILPLLDAGASDVLPTSWQNPERLSLRVLVSVRRAAAQTQAEAMLRANPDLVFRIAGSGEFLSFHAVSTHELYVPADQIVGRSVSSMLPPQVAELCTRAMRRALDSGELQIISYSLDMPPGTSDYEARLVPSGPDEVLCIVRNMTYRTQVESLGRANVSLLAEIADRRRAEEALRASEAQWRSLMESCPDYVATIDSSGRVLFINRPIPGNPDPIIGHSTFDYVVPEAHDQLRIALEAVFGRGEAQSLEIVSSILYPNEFDVRIAPIRGADGSVQSAVLLARDITDRRRAEAERAKIQERLLTAQKIDSLGMLAGGIAHDFNNLLTAILGSASVALLKLPSEGPARRAIETLVSAARRASELTQQLLAYSGRGKLNVHAIDLSEHIRDLHLVLEASVPKQIQLELRLHPELPAVEADVGQIQQVVMNLAINAAEAIGERSGTIVLTTGRQTLDESHCAALFPADSVKPGDHVYLEVTDDGCGMDADTLDKVFDPFFTTKAEGRGLGLAAVLGIVRSHHGALKIHSTPGSGTTFRALFPVSSQPVERLARDVAPPQESGGTVLVVDDENLLRRAARQIIEHFGYSAIEAENGDAAVAIFRERSGEISIVLLDMTMPGLTAEQVIEELRKIRSDVCIVLSSGFNEVEATRRFGGEQIAAFLQKPYTAEQLAQCLANVRAAR